MRAGTCESQEKILETLRDHPAARNILQRDQLGTRVCQQDPAADC